MRRSLLTGGIVRTGRQYILCYRSGRHTFCIRGRKLQRIADALVEAVALVMIEDEEGLDLGESLDVVLREIRRIAEEDKRL